MDYLRKASIVLSAVAAAASVAAHAHDTPEEARNKQRALDMWQAVIVESSASAVLEYMAPEYIQHNPLLESGRDAFYNAVKKDEERRRANPNAPPHSSSRLIHAFADGDLVVLTWYQDEKEPSDPSKTYVTGGFDMLRFNKEGKIVEHWDAVRKPPICDCQE